MKNVDVIRENLLELHRVLVEEERRAYERAHGKTSAGQFLDVLVNDEDFAWLKPLTALIVALDDDEVDHASWAERARTMLRPDAEGGPFQRRYDALVQRSPELVVAHGATMRALVREDALVN